MVRKKNTFKWILVGGILGSVIAFFKRRQNIKVTPFFKQIAEKMVQRFRKER